MALRDWQPQAGTVREWICEDEKCESCFVSKVIHVHFGICIKGQLPRYFAWPRSLRPAYEYQMYRCYNNRVAIDSHHNPECSWTADSWMRNIQSGGCYSGWTDLSGQCGSSRQFCYYKYDCQFASNNDELRQLAANKTKKIDINFVIAALMIALFIGSIVGYLLYKRKRKKSAAALSKKHSSAAMDYDQL